MEISPDQIRELEQLSDGSSVYEIGEQQKEALKTEDLSFYSNIASNFSDEALNRISSFLLDAIEEDIDSRKDWYDAVQKAKSYLGFSLEDIQNMPFKQACRTFDTTLASALMRFYSTARAEILPSGGPAGYKVIGKQTEYSEQIGEKRRDWLNYYLTTIDEPYYQDFERFLLYLGLYGSCFKKVYYDKILNRPISRFIVPEDFIIDNSCPSILEAARLTHVLHLSKREIILNQQNGVFRDIELKYLKSSSTDEDKDENNQDSNDDGIDLNVYTKSSSFQIYEIHTYINLEDFSNDSGEESDDVVPLPYIITIDKTTKEILSIVRNWDEEDPLKKRINYFVHYNYLPGFRIYGLGLAHLIGSNAITLTNIIRQLIDAATYKNIPGGLRVKGNKQQQTDIIVGPGEWHTVDTAGLPLSEAFMRFPYDEPSRVLMELMIEVINQTKELASTSELGMMDSKEDIPTGTAIAFLESNNRIQSAVLKSIHHSLTQELQLLDAAFGKTIEVQDFVNNNGDQQITQDDFIRDVIVIPVSDPSVNSTIQRIMKARSVLEVALQDPSSHDMRAVYEMIYKAQGLDGQEIDSILKPEDDKTESLDPITENQNILLNKPVKAAIWQAHAAHKLSHAIFAESNPELKPIIYAHIKEHEAYEYLIQMQQLLGYELPPLEQISDPQVQNSIAVAIAGQLEQIGPPQNGEDQQQTIDPNTVLLAQIAQKQSEMELKKDIAELRASVDAFKAQLDFEKQKAKIESDEDIAQLRAEVELTKQGINHGQI